MAEQTTQIKSVQHRLRSKNFGEEGKYHVPWQVELEEHHSFDDCLIPEFWADIADRLGASDPDTAIKRKGDILKVWKPDTGAYAEFIVQEVGRGYVRVGRLRLHDEPQVSEPETVPLMVQWVPGNKTFRVIRKADKIEVAKGFATRQLAVDWIARDTAARVKAA